MSLPRTPKPISPRQLAANRANAAASTGPRTPEGKARSARNSVKHGFAATSFTVVRLEDVHEVAHLTTDLVSVYQPANSQELFALQRMAISQQAILRAARLESGLFTTCLNETLDSNDHPSLPMNPQLEGDGDIEITRAQNRNYLLGEGFLRLARQSNGWTLFLRYQAQAERQYRRALGDFDRLKALRPSLPNEANPDLQPQPEPTTYPTSEPNPSPPDVAHALVRNATYFSRYWRYCRIRGAGCQPAADPEMEGYPVNPPADQPAQAAPPVPRKLALRLTPVSPAPPEACRIGLY
jgi:hypothetical protein